MLANAITSTILSTKTLLKWKYASIIRKMYLNYLSKSTCSAEKLSLWVIHYYKLRYMITNTDASMHKVHFTVVAGQVDLVLNYFIYYWVLFCKVLMER